MRRLLLRGAGAFLVGSLGASAATPAPTTVLSWSTIMIAYNDQGRYEQSSLEVPVCYDNACGKGGNQTHWLQLLRHQAPQENAPTVWVVMDSSTADAMVSMVTSIVGLPGGDAISVYVSTSRLWDPPLGTDEAVTTPCGSLVGNFSTSSQIDTPEVDAVQTCSDWMTDRFGSGSGNAYSLDSATRDLETVLGLARANELKGNPNVYILAVGKASRLVQRLMAGYSTAVDGIAGYIFDMPHPMKLPVTQDKIVGDAMDLYFDGCDSDAKCKHKFDSLSMTPREVLTKLYALLDTTPKYVPEAATACQQKLIDVAYVPARDLSTAHGVRRFFAAMRRQPLTNKLFGLVLYRLHRCDADDQTALNGVLEGAKAHANDGLQPADGDSTGWLIAFIDKLITYSEFWPTPMPSWQQFVETLETTVASSGTMVAEQPSSCVYSGDTSENCAILYAESNKPSASLVLTYDSPTTPTSSSSSANASSGLVGSSADVLIFTSRLSTFGSSVVAGQLYDEFTVLGSSDQTAVLIQSDNLGDSELGPKNVNQTAALTLLQLFVTRNLTAAKGKWYMGDFASVVASGVWSSPLPSTFETAPVAFNLSLTAAEVESWLPYTPGDPYGADAVAASSAKGIRTWQWVAIAAGVVCVAMIASICIWCRRSRAKSAQTYDYYDDTAGTPYGLDTTNPPLTVVGTQHSS